ncbi:MAG: isochorismate synthase MenF [Acidiferrobacterales bacterium]
MHLCLDRTIDAHRFLRDLDRRLRDALYDCPDLSETELLSLTLSVPELACGNFHALGKDYVYWTRAEAQHARLGVGRAVTIETQGQQRFDLLHEAFTNLRANWLTLSPDDLSLEPCAFVGFSFDALGQARWHGLANALLFVPDLLLERKGSTCGLTLSVHSAKRLDAKHVHAHWMQQAQTLVANLLNPPAYPTATGGVHRDADERFDHEWLTRAQKALSAIRAGALEKVVLTRRVRVAKAQPLDLNRVLTWLEGQYSSCVQFAVGADDGVLIGASPERLVALDRGMVNSDAVAGTAVREEDLLRNEKARMEQALVVNDIVCALEPFCADLEVPATPKLLALPTLQHLWSPIRGRVKPGVSLLQLAARLHPTPAVGGIPRKEALAWLEQHGEDWRGWYTGALGWLGRDGDGELSVVLRCAMLNARKAELFAGAGIVAGSDPEDELAETERKLQTMLDALAVA